MSDASSLVASVNPLFSAGVPAAVGAPGEPGDIERIEHFANRVAELQSLLLDWTLEFFRVDAPKKFDRALTLARGLSSETIEQIEQYTLTLYDKIDFTTKNHKPGDVVELVLTLTASKTGEMLDELRRIRSNG